MKSNEYSAKRKTILASMILVPFIPFVLVLATGYYYFTHSIETSTIATMRRIISDHRNMIESFLQERKSDLDFILHTHSFEELVKPEALQSVFGHLQRKSSAFTDLGIFDQHGTHVSYSGPYELKWKIYKDTAWFQNVMQNGYYISDIFLGYRRIPHFIIAIAKEKAGRKWVIRATIDTQLFNDLVEKVRIGTTGEAYLVNADGLFQTERRSGGNLMENDPDITRYLAAHDDTDRLVADDPSGDQIINKATQVTHPAVHGGIKTFIFEDQSKEEYLYATTWLKNKDWLLVVRQAKADAFKTLQQAMYLIVLIVVIGGAVIVGVAFYITDWIVRRIEKIDAEKDHLGDQLIRATRLAELGEMAAGFAHEINNPLQIMKSEQGLISMIMSEMKEKGQLQESEDLKDLEDSMSQIQLQINRCAQITQAILKFGRQGQPAAENIDLDRLIPEITAMVAKKAGVHGISIKQSISSDMPKVHADPGQLQQVLLNLYNNAIDAIVERFGATGGELAIESADAEDGMVKIIVKDNGCGISRDNLNKVFSPFFTTKPVGKGTGLGLSVCYGIIQNMGGTMAVDSEKGAGTTFTISLPAAA